MSVRCEDTLSKKDIRLRNRRLQYFLICVFWLSTVVSCLHYGPVPSAKAQTFKIVTGNDFGPFTGVDLPNGGLITEIVESVYREMGFETEFHFGAWDRGYADILNGRFEATFPYQPDQVQDGEFFLTRSLFITRQLVFVGNHEPDRNWTLNDLEGKKYCVARTCRTNKDTHALMDAYKSGLVRAQSTGGCFQMLDQNQVDYLPAYDLHGVFSAHEIFASMDRFANLRDTLGISSFHLLIPRSQTNAVAHQQNFNRALQQIETRGDIDRIIRRHIRSFQTNADVSSRQN